MLAIVVDRTVFHRGHALATAVTRDDLTPAVDTRLRFLRRLVTLAILLLGTMIALSQFGGLNHLAAGVLASSALLAAVVGFAARQTLANLIAGVMLTIAQPLRIGDRVTVESESGTVEDVRLNYTVVRRGDARRVFIPNERLASGILRNDTIVDPLVDARSRRSGCRTQSTPTARSRHSAALPGIPSRASPRSRPTASATRSREASSRQPCRTPRRRRCGPRRCAHCAAPACSPPDPSFGG